MRRAALVIGAVLLLAGTAGGPAPAGAQERREFKDCPECPEMVVVPPGRITRSDLPGKTEYTVDLRRAFAVSKYEITREQFRTFRDSTAYTGSGCAWFSPSGNRPNPDKGWDTAFDPAIHVQARNEPALCVSFDDAQAYVAWLREKTGESYRLLTEAEWEYAARAGSPNDDAWWTGFNTTRSGTLNCADCTGVTEAVGRETLLRPSPAGAFPPNAWGLYDMGGNAAEWVEDCFNPSLEKAPRDATAWLDGDCDRRIVRGGSWHHERAALAGLRQATPVEARVNDIGFRIARSLPE